MGHKLTTKLAYFDELLKTSKSADPDQAIITFNKLCELGCDRPTLAYLLAWYAASQLNIPERSVSIGVEKRSVPAHAINIHSLDSWETALDPKDGRPPITRDELDQVSKRAKRVRSDIRRLSRTPVVRHLVKVGYIMPQDLLSNLYIPTGIFEGLIRLPTLVNEFGPRNKPDRSRALAEIYRHIRDSTGRWHDEGVAELLNALMLNQGQNTITAQSLKQKRKRDGLIDKRGTRKTIK